MHFPANCNSGRIAIQWFHIKHYLDYQHTKFQTYTFRVQKMCVFARYATLVTRLLANGLLCSKGKTALYESLFSCTRPILCNDVPQTVKTNGPRSSFNCLMLPYLILWYSLCIFNIILDVLSSAYGVYNQRL